MKPLPFLFCLPTTTHRMFAAADTEKVVNPQTSFHMVMAAVMAANLCRFCCHGDYSKRCQTGQAQMITEDTNEETGQCLGQLWFTGPVSSLQNKNHVFYEPIYISQVLFSSSWSSLLQCYGIMKERQRVTVEQILEGWHCVMKRNQQQSYSETPKPKICGGVWPPMVCSMAHDNDDHSS